MIPKIVIRAGPIIPTIPRLLCASPVKGTTPDEPLAWVGVGVAVGKPEAFARKAKPGTATPHNPRT